MRDIYIFSGERGQTIFFESLVPGGFLGLNRRLLVPSEAELFNRFIGDDAR